MKIDTTEKWLKVYEALASDVRLNIIGLLAKRSMNIKELADALHLSSAIITLHVRKLEKAQIIKCIRNSTKNAVQKLCSLDVNSIEIQFPNANTDTRKFYEFTIPVGHYTDSIFLIASSLLQIFSTSICTAAQPIPCLNTFIVVSLGYAVDGVKS